MGLAGMRRWRVVLGALALVGIACGIVAWRVLTPTATTAGGTTIVDIPSQDGALGIARRLEEVGVVRSAPEFLALGVVRGSVRSLKAGEYEFPRGTTTLAALVQIENGRVRRHLVLHPEGATLAELARALETERLASPGDLARAASDPRLMTALDVEAPSLEGYLFPDSYNFVRGMTPEQILTRMVQRLNAKLGPDIKAQARGRGLSLHQLLTLASIIEREAVVRDEMPLISAVFWNRLRLGMLLQADPTAQYAAGKERRTLTRADLQLDHPYNTYKYPGLPPGPIASPSLRAVEAALNPARVKYLYFVAMDDQRHHFSMTVEEHNAAVSRYRLARHR
jgi:UPF0755 protein